MLTTTTDYLVVTESRGGHDGVATGGHYGSWARVWASRPGVAIAELAEEEHVFRPGRLAYHHDRVVVRVRLTGSFDPDDDYVVVEHKRSPNPYLRGSPSREGYELLAGRMPAWADFPARWQEWIDLVREDAIEFLVRRAAAEPDADRNLLEAIRYAERKTTKRRVTGAWLCVASAAGVDPDALPSGSWTAVRALPVRIAQRLGWRPPIPRPRYERPEDSGRVLIAGPKGPANLEDK